MNLDVFVVKVAAFAAAFVVFAFLAILAFPYFVQTVTFVLSFLLEGFHFSVLVLYDYVLVPLLSFSIFYFLASVLQLLATSSAYSFAIDVVHPHQDML